MTSPAIELREEIDVRLLANLSDNFRSPYEATFEILDNALAAALNDKPTVVMISGRQGRSLKFVAKGGKGMGAAGLAEFLRWGKKPGVIGLNRYGQGGKAAIGYLGTGFRIHANAMGETIAYEFEDPDWLSRPDGREKTFLARPVPARFPGEGLVELEIYNLRRDVNFKKLERDIAWRYRPALKKSALRVRIKGQGVAPAPLESRQQRSIDELLVFDTGHGTETAHLRGWVGVAPAKFEGRGGVRCSAYGRVVVENEYFGHRTASFKASLNSLIGEVDLSFVPIVLNKNAFEQASPAWEAAQAVMHREMQPLVNQLLERKDTSEPSDAERERAMEARDVAHQAMARIAAESERRGKSGELRGRKPPASRTDERQETKEREAATERRPRTVPPDNAVGRLARRGINLDWDVHALDPKIRSARVIDGGRTEIVINNQFPLYRERGGDMPYMLETGLLEELQPVGDNDKTVAEYHREVTDALHQSLSTVAIPRKRSRR